MNGKYILVQAVISYSQNVIPILSEWTSVFTTEDNVQSLVSNTKMTESQKRGGKGSHLFRYEHLISLATSG